MDNISNLKSGVYLKAGTSLKSLSLNSPDGWEEFLTGNSATPSAETIAANVAWAFIAINHRREAITEIPYNWMNGSREVESFSDLKIVFSQNSTDREEFQRIDAALQIHGYAAYRKIDTMGGKKMLQWLDPAALMPVEETADPVKGYTQFRYNTTGDASSKSNPTYKADEVIFISRKGFRDFKPATPASQAASLAAQILFSMSSSLDSFFDKNGIPPVIIKVPPALSSNVEERNRIARSFERFFNNNKKNEYNTKGIPAGVEVDTIDVSPKSWEASEHDKAKRDEVLLAHGVPPTLVYDSGTLAETREKNKMFINRMGTRLEFIAHKFNTDPDLKRMGIKLVVKKQEHSVFARDMTAVSTSLLNLVKSDIFENEAAAYLIGITEGDFPEEMQGSVFKEQQPVPEPLQNTQDRPSGEIDPEGAEDENDNSDGEAKAAELKRLRKYVKSGKHKKRAFKSSILTDEEIEDVVSELKAARIIPRGAEDPLPPIPAEIEISEGDIENAIKSFDNVFPEFRGLLDAEAVPEEGDEQ